MHVYIAENACGARLFVYTAEIPGSVPARGGGGIYQISLDAVRAAPIFENLVLEGFH